MKFLGIAGSNLDEFFMVRVATLLKKFRAGMDDVSPDGLHTEQQLAAIRQRASQMLDDMATCWQELLRPLLEAEGIRFLEPSDYTPEIACAPRAATSRRDIWPVLTPLAFDPGHPFPHISNLSHNFAVVVRHSGRTKFARVKVPDKLPRFIQLPDRLVAGASGQPRLAFVFIEDVIRANIQELFPGTQVEERAPVPHRPRHGHGDPGRRGRRPARVGRPQPASSCATARCRCCRSKSAMPRRVLDILVENFEVDDDVILRTSDRLGFADWLALTALHRPALEGRAVCRRGTLWAGQDTEAIFDEIRDQDYLVHHPFESFASVERSSAPRSRTRTSSRSR